MADTTAFRLVLHHLDHHTDALACTRVCRTWRALLDGEWWREATPTTVPLVSYWIDCAWRALQHLDLNAAAQACSAMQYYMQPRCAPLRRAIPRFSLYCKRVCTHPGPWYGVGLECGPSLHTDDNRCPLASELGTRFAMRIALLVAPPERGKTRALAAYACNVLHIMYACKIAGRVLNVSSEQDFAQIALRRVRTLLPNCMQGCVKQYAGRRLTFPRSLVYESIHHRSSDLIAQVRAADVVLVDDAGYMLDSRTGEEIMRALAPHAFLRFTAHSAPFREPAYAPNKLSSCTPCHLMPRLIVIRSQLFY